jgi:zinc protease
MRKYQLITGLLAFVLIGLIACSPKLNSTSDSAKANTSKAEDAKEEVVQRTKSVTSKSLPFDPNVRFGKLENGLKYYIQKNGKPEQRAELRLIVNAGSMQEDEDQLGLAHFTEHMAFNGSINFKKNELVDYLESVGSRFGPDLNAYTSFDETVYMLQVRTDEDEHLAKGLLVLEDWAGGLLFDEEEIDKERGVVISEWRSRLSPNQRMQQSYFPIMYQGSRYADRLPIGDPEIIQNADYATVERFYKDWYRPNLMAVAVVGDVNVDQIEEEIKYRFGGLKNPKSPRPRVEHTVPLHDETLISICSDKEANNSSVQIMYKHPSQDVKYEEDYKMNIVRGLYNNMMSNRLRELSLKADTPINFSYSGYGKNVGDIDAYTSYASVKEGKVEEGLELLVTENKRVLDHGFLQSELDRAITQTMTSIEKSFKEMDKMESRRLVNRVVSHFLNDSPLMNVSQRLELYKKYTPEITLKDVNALAAKWLTKENRVLVIMTPEKSRNTVPGETALLNLLNSLDSREVEPYKDEVSDQPFFDVDLSAVEITSENENENIGMKKFTLANGVQVFMKQTDFKNDEVMMTASSDGGHSQYPDEDYLTASLTTSVIGQSGLSEMNVSQLQKSLTGKVVRVNPYIGELTEGLSGSASPDDLEVMMQLVYMYFNMPRKDEEAYASFMQRQKSSLSNLLANPNYYFMDKSIRIKTKSHPRRILPNVSDLESVSLQRIMEIYKDRFADASDFKFFFVGNFDEDNLKFMAQKYLGNLPSIKREEKGKDVGADYIQGRIAKTFRKGEAQKTQVELMFHGDFEWESKNRYDFNAMLDVLRITLRENLREDKGGVYGVRVSGRASQFPKPKYTITISFNADPEKANDLIAAAKDEIRKIRKGTISDEVINKVKETQKQSRIKSQKENRYWLNSIRYCVDNGINLNTLTEESGMEKIEKLTALDVRNASNKYFDYNRSFELIMVPQAEIEK